VAVMILAALAVLGLAHRPRPQPAGSTAGRPGPAPELSRVLATCAAAAADGQR
jgi:hypothetical protein